MKPENIINWFLLITTVLVIGKSIDLIKITWYEAFIPLVLLIVSALIIFILAAAIYLKDQNGNK
jgi:hypothetical protein